MMQNSWTMNPTSSFDALVATASNVGANASSFPPTSPQHCKSTATPHHGYYLGGSPGGTTADEYYSPTCVFAASFDSMAAYEEQQQQYKDNGDTLEHQISRISLMTRSDSQPSLTEDCYDQELMMNGASAPQPPPQVRRTTSVARSSGRTPMASASTGGGGRPSDPVARLLLSK